MCDNLIMLVGRVYTLDECGNVLNSPDGRFRAQFYRLGKAASFASLPPAAFADRDDLKNLRETHKAYSGKFVFHGGILV